MACSSVTATEGVSGRSLLFIGNSLTYVNDLPAMVAKVAEAADDSIGVAMVAGPNLAVIDHVNGASDAVAQISRGGWSLVVLQGADRDCLEGGVARRSDRTALRPGRISPRARRYPAGGADYLRPVVGAGCERHSSGVARESHGNAAYNDAGPRTCGGGPHGQRELAG